jgi:hypothetical protein
MVGFEPSQQQIAPPLDAELPLILQLLIVGLDVEQRMAPPIELGYCPI